jgi:hypothetical protein
MKYLNRCFINWIFTGPDFFGKGIRIKRNIGQQNGVSFVDKNQGGLGVLNLELQNKCLLSKWLFSLINSEGPWQQLIKNKYLGSKTITQVTRRPGDSQF